MAASVSLNVALVPSASVAQRAIRLSKSLQQYGGLFVLNKTLYSTHITLYMVEVPLKNLPSVKKALARLSAQISRPKLEPIHWHQTRTGYIDVEYKKTVALAALQRRVIEAINPLREGLLRPKDRQRLKTLQGPERKNIEKYGFRSVGAAFKPHLTLTKLKAFTTEAIPNVDPKQMAFTARELGVFYLGEYGTTHKLIGKYVLRG